jgi:hypothetical protein
MQLAQLPTPIPVDTGGSVLGVVLIVLLVVLTVPVAGGFFTAWLAEQKGRERRLWFVLGFFFGPIALLAVGFAPDVRLADIASRPGAEPPRPDYPPPPAYDGPYERVEPPPPARPQPIAQYEPVSRASAPIGVDIDAVVFHEPTQQGYGRGRTDTGEMVYFTVTQDELRDMTERLRLQRPFASFVASADIVETYDLPQELRPTS